MNHYSQNDEQEVILEFFRGRTGHFLDIGAYDGVTFSNTRALLERGWSGIMVEPSPRNVVKLMESVERFAPKVVVFPVAVGGLTGFGRLFEDATEGREWASTLAPNSVSVMRAKPTYLNVPILDVNALLRDGASFLSVDAEYMDFEIVKAINSGYLGMIELICIEPRDTQEREQMKGWFNARGFVVHHETPENLIVRRNVTA